MKHKFTLTQTIELIRMNAHSGTKENLEAIIDLTYEAEKLALHKHNVMPSLPELDADSNCDHKILYERLIEKSV